MHWSVALSPVPRDLLIYVTGLGTASLVQVTHPASAFAHTTNLAVPYATLSLSLNIIVTVMISGYLLWHCRTMQASLGREHGKQYTSIIAMLVESAALFAVFSVIPFLAL